MNTLNSTELCTLNGYFHITWILPQFLKEFMTARGLAIVEFGGSRGPSSEYWPQVPKKAKQHIRG